MALTAYFQMIRTVDETGTPPERLMAFAEALVEKVVPGKITTLPERFVAFAKQHLQKTPPSKMTLGPMLFDGRNWMVGVSNSAGRDCGLIMTLGLINPLVENFGFFDYTEDDILITAAKQMVGPKVLLTVD